MLDRLTASIDFQGTALSLRSERTRMIASNIANADTPGYVARDMNFASALKAATGASPGGTRLALTQTGHSEGNLAGGLQATTLRYAVASQSSLDNNTVDMDRERAAFADNAIKYEATLRFINGNAKTMMDAIKGNS